MPIDIDRLYLQQRQHLQQEIDQEPQQKWLFTIPKAKGDETFRSNVSSKSSTFAWIMPNWTKPFENATLSPHLSLLFFRLTFYRTDLQRKRHQGSNLDRKSTCSRITLARGCEKRGGWISCTDAHYLCCFGTCIGLDIPARVCVSVCDCAQSGVCVMYLLAADR